MKILTWVIAIAFGLFAGISAHPLLGVICGGIALVIGLVALNAQRGPREVVRKWQKERRQIMRLELVLIRGGDVQARMNYAKCCVMLSKQRNGKT